ncbi:glycosyl transferase family 2 [Tenacibaculum sp. SG-28]|nr:glycosyl transferase family 2 [Tenacibaculum sp. SG-28]
MTFSIIVPVYNRPAELQELLVSLTEQNFEDNYEVIVVEDGSETSAESIVDNFHDRLNIFYFYKDNSGAGLSRNYGMQRASKSYYIILDSDVIVPPNYLSIVKNRLEKKYTDAYGGPDAAHESFTALQKAINFSMTSFITTGGIRGKMKGLEKFQPRSFNLGISREAFQLTGGFSNWKTGEDIDLTFRLWKLNLQTQLIPEAFVYHKRRSTLKQFFKQTYGFGKARPRLNNKYPGSAKLTYWFPSLFLIGIAISGILLVLGFRLPIYAYLCYILVLFIVALQQTKSISVALWSILTSITQFCGYGLGFINARFFGNKPSSF